MLKIIFQPQLKAIAAVQMLMLLTFVIPFTVSANQSCRDLILYRYGNQISHSSEIQSWSLRPEIGSLEDKYPGIAKAINSVMYGILPHFNWTHIRPIHPSEIESFFKKVLEFEDAITKIPKAFNLQPKDAQRFYRMREIVEQIRESERNSINFFVPTSSFINKMRGLHTEIQSSLQVLLVSTLIEGKAIYMETDSMIVHGKARIPGIKKGPDRKVKDREIDLIVEKDDGHFLWIEVKNNSLPWDPQEFFNWCRFHKCDGDIDIQALKEQSEQRRTFAENHLIENQLPGQLRLRSQMGLAQKVELVVVLKYPESNPDFLQKAKEMGVQVLPLFSNPSSFQNAFFQSIMNGFNPKPEQGSR